MSILNDPLAIGTTLAIEVLRLNHERIVSLFGQDVILGAISFFGLEYEGT